MKKIIINLLFSTAFCTSTMAQEKAALSKKDLQTLALFQQKKKQKNYKKFAGTINVRENNILFNDKILSVENGDILTREILLSGVVYPQLLSEYQKEKYIAEMDRTQRRYYQIQKDKDAPFDVHNFTAEIIELKMYQPKKGARYFKMITRNKKFANSVLYYFELANNKAPNSQNISELLKDAKLTQLTMERQ